MSRRFDMENLLMISNNLITAESLYNEIGNAKQKILENRLIPLLKKYAKSKGLVESIDYDVTGSRYSGFSFKRNNWNDKYGIGFEFEGSDYQNLIYGIHLDDGNKPSASVSERKSLRNLYPESKSSNWWPCYFRFDENYESWSTEVFMKINENPEEVANLITDKVSEILEKIDSMQT